MRKIPLLLFILFFLACDKPKPKPLNVYNLTVNKLELNIYNGRFEEEPKIDTIMAVNDTVAYQNGLIAYYSALKTEESFKEKGIIETSRTKSFSVTDTAGLNVKYNLSEKVVDSLTMDIKKIVNKLRY